LFPSDHIGLWASIEQRIQFIESGFEYVIEMEGLKIVRKSKLKNCRGTVEYTKEFIEA
jgi:hypothetical protein